MEMVYIIYPIAALLVLSAVVWFAMTITRLRSFGDVKDPSAIGTRDKVQSMLKGSARLTSDNFDNLFEVPVLFYVLTILIAITGTVSLFYVVCAWIFVALRCVHSAIQCTYNNVMHRFAAYGVATLVLWLMLICFVSALL